MVTVWTSNKQHGTGCASISRGAGTHKHSSASSNHVLVGLYAAQQSCGSHCASARWFTPGSPLLVQHVLICLFTPARRLTATTGAPSTPARAAMPRMGFMQHKGSDQHCAASVIKSTRITIGASTYWTCLSLHARMPCDPQTVRYQHFPSCGDHRAYAMPA